ncbi:MAG: ethanolamine utilization protein EutN [Thermoplasmata archaeon]|nr:MAG: ethanolamine utilization protein EutN [Thermoplasmata archaeon]
MNLARVIGEVWAGKAHTTLVGCKLLLLKTLKQTSDSPYFVAMDIVDAGVGDVVLVAFGSAALQSEITKMAPIDAAVIGVIDPMQEIKF